MNAAIATSATTTAVVVRRTIARGKATEVVVTHELLSESARPSHSKGWTSGLEHLDASCQQGLLKSPKVR
jgi:hypothetical protein